MNSTYLSDITTQAKVSVCISGEDLIQILYLAYQI